MGQWKTLPAKKIFLCPDKTGNKLLANISYISLTTENLSDHDYDLSKSLKVKCHWTHHIWFPIDG